MLTRIRRLPSPAFVIASIALILAVGGGSFALAITDKKSDKKIAKKVATKVANKQITKRAPQLTVGNASQLGNKGPGAYAGATEWALVSPGPSVLAQSGGISAASFGAGHFLVQFPGNVAGHALSVTLSDLQGSGVFARVAPCGGPSAGPDAINCGVVNNPNTASVRVFDSAGNSIDKPFYIEVFN